MNKYVLLLVLLIGTGSMFSQSVSLIEGSWRKGNNQTVRLYGIENGDLHELATSTTNPDNKFYFAFAPQKEGFYAIATHRTQPKDRYLFYFKPGDKLNVVISADGYSLMGDNTPENRELEKWQAVIAPLEAEAVYRKTSGMTYKEFFPLLEEKVKEATAYQVTFTGNKEFDEQFTGYRKLSLLDQALFFLYTPRASQPGGEEYPSYYSEITLRDVTPRLMLNYPGSMELLGRYVGTLGRLQGKSYKSQSDLLVSAFINDAFSWLTDKEVQGEVILSFARYNKTYEGMDAYRKKYKDYLFTGSQKERMDKMVLSVFNPDEGEDAVDFKFPDVNGKEVALSDLKGKVVYIDVWATWCMPCQKEIPYLKKLEHEYEGKNIVFLSVSTDQAKDYEKWKAFIEKEELGGIQLFAGDKAREDLLKPYKITGVPRFILVNKEGKIVNANSPRPSSDEIRALLNAIL